MDKTVSMINGRNSLVLTNIYFQILWWTESSKEQHLFEIDIFCNIVHVFTVTFDQLTASLLEKSINFFRNKNWSKFVILYRMIHKFRMDLINANLSRHRNGWCGCWIQEGGREPWQHSHAHRCQFRWHHHTWTARRHQSRLLLLHGCGWKTSNWLMTSCGLFLLSLML